MAQFLVFTSNSFMFVFVISEANMETANEFSVEVKKTSYLK